MTRVVRHVTLLQSTWLGMFAAAGSLARVVGPLLVTEIYQELGSYWMLGIVGILMVSLMARCDRSVGDVPLCLEAATRYLLD